jgi:hypothetical protein
VRSFPARNSWEERTNSLFEQIEQLRLLQLSKRLSLLCSIPPALEVTSAFDLLTFFIAQL